MSCLVQEGVEVLGEVLVVPVPAVLEPDQGRVHARALHTDRVRLGLSNSNEVSGSTLFEII